MFGGECPHSTGRDLPLVFFLVSWSGYLGNFSSSSRTLQCSKSIFGQPSTPANPQTFSRFLRRNRKIKWIVYAKPPFGGPAQVLDYLGRYTHRIAISNHRLLSFHDDKVTFQWKDRKTGHCNKTLTLDAQEFIRRFLIHVLPHGFPKIRYFGFLANRQRSASLLLCRQLLNASGPETDPQILDWKSRHQALTGDSLELCPICRQGRMLLIQTLVPLWTLHSCRRRKRPQSIPQAVSTDREMHLLLKHHHLLSLTAPTIGRGLFQSGNPCPPILCRNSPKQETPVLNSPHQQLLPSTAPLFTCNSLIQCP